MKNKLLVLTMALLKNGSGIKLKGKKINSQMLIILLVGLSLLPVMISLVNFIATTYDSLSTIGQEGIIVSLGIAAGSMIIFFFGVFAIINTFYFSSDVENLLPLPLKPSHIISAKFIVVAIYEYIIELFVVLPMFLIYGIKSNAGPVFYLYGLIIFALIPVIPLVIGSIIVMIIMKFAGSAVNKDRFRMVGGILALLVALGGNVLIQRFTARAVDPEQLMQMLEQGQNSLLNVTSRLFPGSQFAALGLINYSGIKGLINMVIFIGIAALSFVVFQYIGELLYFRGVIGISETSARRKKISSKDMDKVFTHRPAIMSYTLKELRLLIRTPIYFLNCVLINIIWPVLMLIPYLSQSDDLDGFEGFKDFLAQSGSSGMMVAIGFGLAVLVAASNQIAASAISREGKNFYINKYLPVSYMIQIGAKALSAIIISLLGMAVMLLTVTLLLKLPVHIVFLIAAIGPVGIVFATFIGIILDIMNPKLNWDSEHKAVKQNMNVVFSMMIGIACAGAAVLAVLKLEITLIPAFLLIFAVFGLLDIGLYSFLKTKGVRMFENI